MKLPGWKNFKLIPLLSLFLLLPALPAGAWQFGAGVKLGPSIIYQSGEAAQAFQRDFGVGLAIINPGVFAQLRTCRFSSLQLELLYTRKGQGGFGAVGTQVRAHYLEVPFLVKLTTPPEWVEREDISFNLFLGPAFSFLAGGAFLKEKAYWLRGDRTGIFRESISNEYRSVDFGGVAGIGLDWDRGWGVMTFDIRYTSSLTNAAEFDSAEYASGIWNRAFSLMVGLMWIGGEEKP